MDLRAQITCYLLKGDLNPVVLNKIFPDSLKISKFTIEGFVWKTIQAWQGGKSCFSHFSAAVEITTF